MSTPQELAGLAWDYFQLGALENSEQLYRQAVAADPQYAEAWCFLGIVCKARGNLEGAVESYRAALAVQPNFQEALNNLGNVFVMQERFDEAVACFRQAIKVNPEFAQPHSNLGATLRKLGKLDEALACYREALRLKPAYADAQNNLGDALSGQGKFTEAAPCYREALRLQPVFPEAHNNLGVSLAKLGKLDEALKHYAEALRQRPNYADAYLNLGNLQAGQKKTAEAIASYRRVLQINPKNADAHYNLGIIPAEEGRLDEAIAHYREALRLKPNHAGATANLGHALRAQGKFDEAMSVYQQLLSQNPDDPEGHMSRALVWLLLGDYERGWPEYEWRWKTKEFAGTRPKQPEWDGSPLDGRTILLTAEQGMGDTMQFVRYASEVKRRGGTVLLRCQEGLIPLMKTCPGIDECVAPGEKLPQFDVHASLLSLPAILKTTLASVPAEVPYLSAESERIEQWRGELDKLPGFKIGIAWQGNPQYRGDRERSVPLAAFEPIANVKGVQLISLQKGPGTEQLAEVASRFSVTDLGSRLDLSGGAFLDTAAVIKFLDLVITINTSLAHLAGALAAPAWIALGSGASDWRWLLDRDDSPWYPSLRLFRQSQFGDWSDVMERMASELAKRPS